MFKLRPIIMLLAACLAGLTAAGASAAPAPRRIVSLNVCADQLLIALADSSQIAALSPFARDPGLSFHADRAKNLPRTSSSLEEVLMLRPDLVLAPPSRIRDGLARLDSGVAIVDLDLPAGLAGIIRNIRIVAKATGHAERGELMIAALNDRVRRLETARAGRGRIAAFYQRRGYLTGTGTLTDELMRRAGLVNLASELGRPVLSRLSLEEMIIARPDFLVMDTDARTISDRGTELLHHPALDRVAPSSRRLYLPQPLTVCGGPFYADALALLIAQIKAADRRRASDIGPR